MKIRVKFESGEIVEITHELLALFLEGKTNPTETIAILHAAQVDWKTGLILKIARKNGTIPKIWGNVKVEKIKYVNLKNHFPKK